MFHLTVIQTVLVIGGLSLLILILCGSIIAIVHVYTQRKRNSSGLMPWNFNSKSPQTSCPYSEKSLGENSKSWMSLYNMDNLEFDNNSVYFRNIHMDSNYKIQDAPKISQISEPVETSGFSEVLKSGKLTMSPAGEIGADVPSKADGTNNKNLTILNEDCGNTESHLTNDMKEKGMVDVDLGTPQEAISAVLIENRQRFQCMTVTDQREDVSDPGNTSISVLDSQDLSEDSVPY